MPAVCWHRREVRLGCLPKELEPNFPEGDFWPASKGAALAQHRLPFSSSRQQRAVVVKSFDQAL